MLLYRPAKIERQKWRTKSGSRERAVRRRKSDQWRIDVMDVLCSVVEWDTFRSIDLIIDSGATAAASKEKCHQYLCACCQSIDERIALFRTLCHFTDPVPVFRRNFGFKKSLNKR